MICIYDYRERAAECGKPTHAGWEVIRMTGGHPDAWTVMALCRDEQTAELLTAALYRESAGQDMAT